MPNRSPQPRAGGVLLAISLLAGAGLGLLVHQPTIGLLLGLAAGTLLCLVVWVADR